MKEYDTFVVQKEQEETRLDILLKKRYEDLSRSYCQYLIDSLCVHVNGAPVKKRSKLQSGDSICVHFPQVLEETLSPEDIPLDILFEDEHLLVINKPAGMLVHPAPGYWSGTVANALIHHCKERPSTDPMRPGIVHRLDKDTSGVLLTAKTPQAMLSLAQQFHDRLVKKSYLALCYGNPGTQVVDQPIGRDPINRRKMGIVDQGRKAVTAIRSLAHTERFSLVEAHPETGRTHQIRVHLRFLQTPIVGDLLYGSPHEMTERQLLHAVKLTVRHPLSNQELTFHAPLPADMCDNITKFFPHFILENSECASSSNV